MLDSRESFDHFEDAEPYPYSSFDLPFFICLLDSLIRSDRLASSNRPLLPADQTHQGSDLSQTSETSW